MTRKESREARISTILDAAVAVFLERGYENTTMEALAERAGLTKGGLYHHFRSKDEVLLGANQRFLVPVTGFMMAAAASPSPANGLASYIRHYLEFWTARPREVAFTFLSLTKIMEDPKGRRLYRDYAEQMKLFFESMYRRGLECGEFRSIDSLNAAVALMSALDGVIAYLVLEDSPDPSATIAAFTDLFITRFQESQT